MAEYKRLDDNGLLYFATSFKNRIKALIPTKTSELTNDSNFIRDASYVHTDNNYTTADKTKVANAAPLESPAFTGTPTAPTAASGTNTTQIATTAFVMDAVGGITGLDFKVVDALPSTGETGVIYLVAQSGASAPNVYNEYIWLSTTSSFEMIGTTQTDLSGYVQATEMSTITNTEIDTIINTAFAN